MLKSVITILLVLMALPFVGSAQGTDSVTTATVPVKPDKALDFLRRMETKNQETKSLVASFTQVRSENVWGDEVQSEGKFWYRQPDLFRATYKSDASTEVWMKDGMLINYTPSMDQVDVVKLDKGEDAPVHQVLLGFGAKVDKIQDIFDVSVAEERDGLFGINFKSKDLSRSMEYSTIKIYFDEKKIEPRIIIAEDPDQTITMTLRDIKFNAQVSDKIFETNWPDDVVINRHGF